jgi:hypothetical protein
MTTQNDFEKTIKKYAKPQLLLMEDILKQAGVLAGLIYLICLIGSVGGYFMGELEFFGEVFAHPILPAFVAFVLYNVFVGGIRSYKIQRAQILEEDEPIVEISGAGEGAAATPEINKLRRTVENLAVDIALLQQQVKTLNQFHWQENGTKK